MSMQKSFKEILFRSLFALIGVVILGLGAATLRIGQVGLDPYTSSNIALGNLLGLSLGVYQLLMNGFLLVLLVIFGRKYIGTGTVINMVGAGFFIDFFTKVMNTYQIEPNSWFSQLLFLSIGVLIFTFGASFYMAASVGTAPYDAIAPVIVDYTKLDYRFVRVIQDVGFSLIAYFFQGPVGVGTFISAFLMGPFIKFWDQKVSYPIIESSLKKESL